MQNPQPSRRFRWIGQPSEEELLGVPVVGRHREHAAVRPARVPPERQVVITPAPTRRFSVRDVLTLLALGAIAALAVVGAGPGFLVPGSAAAPLEATEAAPGSVVDRAELGLLPRAVPSGGRAGREDGRKAGSKPKKKQNDPPGGGGGGAGGGGGGGGAGGGGGGGDNPAPAEPPLLEAHLPVVGTVTVDEPDLPLPEAEAPPLPDTDEVVPETPASTLTEPL
jgi:hypothetical protein